MRTPKRSEVLLDQIGLPRVQPIKHIGNFDMNHIAQRLARIKPSPTASLFGKVAQLRAEGKSIIGLVAGEPDFDTPENIKAAAVRAIAAGETKYTAVEGTRL